MSLRHPFTLLTLLVSLPAHAEEITLSCDQNSAALKTPYSDDTAAKKGTYCNGATAPDGCQNTVNAVISSSEKLMAQQTAACGHVQALKDDVTKAASLPPKDFYGTQVRLYQGLLGDYNDYQKALVAQYQAILNTMRGAAGPLQAGTPDLERKQIAAALEKVQAVQALHLTHKGSDISDTPDPNLLASRSGTTYMQTILGQLKDTKDKISTIQQFETNAQTNLNNTGQVPGDPQQQGPAKPPPSSSVTSPDSGLDLKSLAALGTAGAGLAQMMKSQQQSSINTDTGAATSPTPNSNPEAGAKSGPEKSSLGDTKQAAATPPAADKKTPAAAPNRAPSGAGFHDGSDISKSPLAPQFPTTASASSAPPKGAGGGGGGGGGFTSSGGDPAARHEPSAAAGNPNGTDETPGFGGGGLGGGGPPSFNAGAPGGPPGAPGAEGPPANPEDSMKDLLHEMKETAEGNVPGGEVQAGAQDIAMSDEDLFPRVRACYVRVMKAGRILDGLGEKITPENQ